jgi:NADH-quinone oxidoreductase subunit N
MRNIVASTPILIMSGAGVLALLLGLVPSRPRARAWPTLAAGAGIVAAFAMCIVLWGDRQEAFNGNLRADRFSMFLSMLVLIAAAATLALSWREPASVDRRGELAGLITLTATGMMLVVSAGDIIVLFLGIELLSVSLYILCAIEVWRERSLESGLKYLITGAVGSAFLIYGLAFLFGATGETSLTGIGEALAAQSLTDEPLLIVALAGITAGLAFKASAVPFHMWTPDVYEGAPTPITAFMATATKVAAFGAFMLLFTGALAGLEDDWNTVIAALAAITIVVGNVAALVQTNVKRMLAYSGIAQAGYLLIGVAAGTIAGAEATIYYLLAYLVMTLAAFAVVVIRERETEDGDQLAAFTGYGRERPLLGVVMAVSLLSLAGFPPLAGFVGKFLLFGSAVQEDVYWLAIVGAVGSMVSLGYYLRVLGVMFLGAAPDPAVEGGPVRKILRIHPSVGSVAILSAAAVVGFAIAAGPVLDLCRGAAESLLAP